MAEATTKANISLGDCVLEFSGSEAFVQKQIDEFKGLIREGVKPVKSGKQRVKPLKENAGETDDLFDKYPNVIEYDEESINILDVDGKNNTVKTKNLAFIYLWAKEKFHKNAVPTGEIAKQCEAHGCFGSNFSTVLKDIDKKYVTLKGKGKSQTIKLTAPGRKKAGEYIKSLNDKEN